MVEGAALEKQYRGNSIASSNLASSAIIMTEPTFIIDFDSTIISCESLDELARLALKDRPDQESIVQALQKITDQGMAGALPFDESLRRRLMMFAAKRTHIEQLTALLRARLTPSVRRNHAWFAANAERIYVISGGFEDYIVPVVAELGIAADHVLANAFVLDPDGAVRGHDESRHLSKAAGKVLQVAALKLPRPVIVIGDGYTDSEIRAAGQADEFWAFCENARRPNVVERADRVLDSFDAVIETDKAAVQ